MTGFQTTSHEACVAFLKWCLPQLRLRWKGYSKVHRIVCKRLGRRLAELGIGELSQYQTWLAAHPNELIHLQAMLRIPISRFYRDRDVFQAIAATVLPTLAKSAIRTGAGSIRCWSAGCASGEEPYTLLLIWHFLLARDWPRLNLKVVATDADGVMISRARVACYGLSSLRDLPQTWIAQAFQVANGLLCLSGTFRDQVDFRLEDITKGMPDGPFEIVLCRNLVFTYFDEMQQRLMLAQTLDRLAPGGFLVLGKHEALPSGSGGLVQVAPKLPIYRRITEDDLGPRVTVQP